MIAATFYTKEVDSSLDKFTLNLNGILAKLDLDKLSS